MFFMIKDDCHIPNELTNYIKMKCLPYSGGAMRRYGNHNISRCARTPLYTVQFPEGFSYPPSFRLCGRVLPIAAPSRPSSPERGSSAPFGLEPSPRSLTGPPFP